MLKEANNKKAIIAVSLIASAALGTLLLIDGSDNPLRLMLLALTGGSTVTVKVQDQAGTQYGQFSGQLCYPHPSTGAILCTNLYVNNGVGNVLFDFCENFQWVEARIAGLTSERASTCNNPVITMTIPRDLPPEPESEDATVLQITVIGAILAIAAVVGSIYALKIKQTGPHRRLH